MISKEKFFEIKGKIMVCAQTREEAEAFEDVLVELFDMLEEASQEDFYGREGFEHRLGWDQ